MTFVLALVLTGTLLEIYWVLIRRWFFRWGASTEDLHRSMRGDDVIKVPTYAATLAVTIDATPGCIWPWLMQMGYRRGGLYSYDWLDRLFGYLDAPSADVILSKYQDLRPGDQIPIGRGGAFPVRAIEPLRTLVLGGEADGAVWVWELGLYPIGAAQTRLVSRNTVRAPRTLAVWCLMRVMEPAAFIMTRGMLLGIKRRAEGLAAREARNSAA